MLRLQLPLSCERMIESKSYAKLNDKSIHAVILVAELFPILPAIIPALMKLSNNVLIMTFQPGNF